MAQGSLKIGRIFGIDIELHWLFILLILLALYFSAFLGLVLILLFICVLIHELSHSVTAMRNGIRVSRIMLLPIGGVSMMDNPSTDPSVEFNIAIAGPIMSLLLGGVFGVMVIFTPPGLLTYIVQFLFLINMLLGIFNILPAFPMDGGRVLRSYLQKRIGLYRATLKTATVSKYCMALIVLGTIALIAIPGLYSTPNKYLVLLWNLVVVFFLYEGMKAEVDNVTLKQQTRGMKISSAMTRQFALVPYLAAKRTLYAVVRRRKEHIILTKAPDGKFRLVNLFNKPALSKASRVGDMAMDVPNIEWNTGIVEALGAIEQGEFRIGVIVRRGRLLGIATSSHVNAFLTLHVAGSGGKKAFNN